VDDVFVWKLMGILKVQIIIYVCVENVAYFYDMITFSKLLFQRYFRNVIKNEEYQTQD